MTARGSFLIYGLVVSAAGGAGLLLVGIWAAEPTWAWTWLGWAMMTVVGLAGGSRLVTEHGCPGSGFLRVMGVCMLARFGLAGLGAWAASARGVEAVGPYLIGLGAGYVPMLVFEGAWFLRAASGGAAQGTAIGSVAAGDRG